MYQLTVLITHQMHLNKKIQNAVVFSLIILLSASCIVVKKETPVIVEVNPPQLAPISTIALSGETFFSPNNDFAIQLPQEWSGKNLPETPGSIIGLYSNPDVTLLLVISQESKVTEEIDYIKEAFLEETADNISAKRSAKNSVVRTSEIDLLEVQDIGFAIYRMSSSGGAIESRNAVFISKIGLVYNLSLIPINDIMNKMPSPEEIDSQFYDVLYTVIL